jgi:hypothetical protein
MKEREKGDRMSDFNFGQMLSMYGTFANAGLGRFQGGIGVHHRQHHAHGHGAHSPGSCSPGGGPGGQFGSQHQHLISQVNRMREDMRGLFGGDGAFGVGPFGESSGWQPGGGSDCGCPYDQSPWTVTNQGDGKADIDLGKYSLDLDKSNMQWNLTNKETGAVTKVSGDPHVSESGNNWDFHKDTTLQLDDGTRITVHTEPYKVLGQDTGQTVSSTLEITRGGHGMRVTGLGGDQDGPLQVADGLNGYALDAANLGTQVLFEAGNNWQTFDGLNVNSDVAQRERL